MTTGSTERLIEPVSVHRHVTAPNRAMSEGPAGRPVRQLTPACSTLAAALRRLAKDAELVAEPTSRRTATAPSTEEHADDDRRSLPRRASRASVQIALCRENVNASEWELRSAPAHDVLDLTLSSLAFVSDDPIPADRRLVARVTRHTTGDRLDVRGHVVRCRATAAGHDVVVAFDRRMTLEQVETFGRSLIDSPFV